MRNGADWRFLCAVLAGRLSAAFTVSFAVFLTLGEYVLQRDFHIDELFMRAYTTAGVTQQRADGVQFGVLPAADGRVPAPARLGQKRFQEPRAGVRIVSALIGSVVLGLGA